MSVDVDMKPLDEQSKEEKKEEKTPPPPPTPVQEIKTNVALIERGVQTLEPRFTQRALRTLTGLRRKLDDKVLRDAINETYPKGTSRMFMPTSRY